MAAPADVTLKDLSGQWNKTLSDDINAILTLQGIGWFLRKAITLATITLTTTQYIDSETSLTHIDILQRATGGVSSTTEKRLLNWEWRSHADRIFGEVKGRSRFVELKDVDDDDFLKEGWLDETDGLYVQSYTESVGNGWTANQIWGFEDISGKRYHVRHVVVRTADDWKQARLVYDFQKRLD
ncbi:hypothetical protein MMC12_002723 [Toensbergia leucococca]|nr:hypothetical protein [Toensbergia leucococca]